MTILSETGNIKLKIDNLAPVELGMIGKDCFIGKRLGMKAPPLGFICAAQPKVIELLLLRLLI